MHLNSAFILGIATGLIVLPSTKGFVVTNRGCRTSSFVVKVGSWDNDDFLASLSSTNKETDPNPDPGLKPMEGDGAGGVGGGGDGVGRFKEIFDQGRQAAQNVDSTPTPTNQPVSFEQIANELLNSPPPQQQQQQVPPAYPPPPPGYPPVDPNNPYAAYPPPMYPPYPYPPPPQAQNTDPNAPPPPPPPYYYPPYPYPPPPVDPNNPNAGYPPPPPPVDPNNPYAAYPPPAQQAQPQPPAPPQPQQQQQTIQPRQDSSPRPVGRNRDADQIANTADLYFAQLKLDSKIRKKALMEGDEEKFNTAFGDERVKDLGKTLESNPYIQAEREKYKKEKEQLYETWTSDDIALEDLGPSEPAKPAPVAPSGVNFRELLKKKKGGSTK